METKTQKARKTGKKHTSIENIELKLGVSHLIPTGRYALEVVGDSMLPEFEIGDLVIIDHKRIPVTGDYVISSVDRKCNLHQIKILDDGFELTLTHPSCETRSFTSDEISKLKVSIVGVVCELRRSKLS